MSYLDLPRLHFFGSFRAAPSTVNNTPSNYKKVTNPGWNPNGAHQFQFLQGNESGLQPGAKVDPVKVQSLCIKPGKYLTDASGDPLIGGFVVSLNKPVPGKLVDLDPQQQGVSQIWGMQLGIGDPSGQWLVGTFEPTCFRQMWGRMVNSPGGSFGAGAFFQSVLTGLQWPKKITSPFLKALYAASPKQLSIKFNVDLHNNTSPTPQKPNPQFTIGRVAGTIGPADAGEPHHFILGRRIFPASPVVVSSGPVTSGPVAVAAMAAQLKSGAAEADEVAAAAAPPPVQQPLNPAPFLIDTTNSRLVLDLGNSLLDDRTGNPVNMGTLQVVPAGSTTPLFTINYSLANYIKRAYVYDVALTSAQVKALSATPLQIIQSTSGNTVVAAEQADGSCFDAEEYVYRQQPGTTAPVTFRAAFFGQPAPKGHNITILGVQTFAGQDSTDVSFPSTTIPIKSGKAGATMSTAAPNPPRQFIDGQVYAVSYGLDGNDNPDQSAFLSVLTHAKVAIPAKPTWDKDVAPILTQYADLYPFMKGLIDLGNQQKVIQNKQAIIQRLTLPMTDPGFMPVERDLSDAKRTIIINWLNSLPTGKKASGPIS